MACAVAGALLGAWLTGGQKGWQLYALTFAGLPAGFIVNAVVKKS